MSGPRRAARSHDEFFVSGGAGFVGPNLAVRATSRVYLSTRFNDIVTGEDDSRLRILREQTIEG